MSPKNVFRDQRRFAHVVPEWQSGNLLRPRVTDLIDARIAPGGAALLITAPGGFGKTTAITEWARGHIGRVAWLGIGPFAPQPEVLGFEILHALQKLARSSSQHDLRHFLEIADERLPPSALLDLLLEAASCADAPFYLVIDDAHRAGGALSGGVLGALLAEAHSPLRIVIAGSDDVELRLCELLLNHHEHRLTSADLAFTEEEVGALFAQASTSSDVHAIHEETRGWPIAVRAAQLTRVDIALGRRIDGPVFTEYIRSRLLGTLPSDLEEFVLTTSVCHDITPGLAQAVTGDDAAHQKLEHCVSMGLFLDRYDTREGPVYRWHELFAKQCRSILQERDPRRLHDGFVAAARYTSSDQPLSSMGYWLDADEPELAVTAMLAHWPQLLVGREIEPLYRWCAQLPHPYNDDPRVLLVRACAQDILGDSDFARMLLARAEARADGTVERSSYEALHAQASVQLADDRGELVDATRAMQKQLIESPSMTGATRAALTYLAGYALLRHRRDPPLAVQFLSAAVVEAEAVSNFPLADRARSQLAYTLAWSGEFRSATRTLQGRPTESDSGPWVRYAGSDAAATTAAGHVAFWQGDLELARQAFSHALQGANAHATFAGIARMMFAFTAAALHDPLLCRRAAQELHAIPNEMRQGVSWPAFRHAATAALHEAAGHRGRALGIVDRYAEATDLPLVTALLAGIATRAGKHDLAAQMLARQSAYSGFSYLKVAKCAGDAMLMWNEGHRDGAHESIEHALDLATEEHIAYPFAQGGMAMRRLLHEHLTWGTEFEGFITRCFSPETPRGPLQHLSEREQAVFAEMRTDKTMQEIADALEVSINTVKTHQRSIYRKLDVSTRRDAVRQFS